MWFGIITTAQKASPCVLTENVDDNVCYLTKTVPCGEVLKYYCLVIQQLMLLKEYRSNIQQFLLLKSYYVGIQKCFH